MLDQPPVRCTCLKVFLVEDSPALQVVLTNALLDVPGLELAGIADTVAAALAAFALRYPDVVILDLVLREGNALDLLQTIKRAAPACRVLVFTGHDGEAFRTRCRAAGADWFFSKITQHRELKQKLRDLGGEVTNERLTPGPLAV